MGYKDIDLEQKELEENSKGFICLGFSGNSNYIWSNFKNYLFKINPNEMVKSYLNNIVGNRFIKDNYEKINDKGMPFIDYGALSNDIINGCQKKGVYNVEKQRGAGVWSNNKDELIINSKEIFSTDANFNGSRIQNDGIYIYTKDLDISSNTKQSNEKERLEIYEVFKSFNWKRKEQDAKLMLGWTMHSLIAGALKWRVHGYVSGEAGSGKSYLQKLIELTLSNNSILIDGDSSEAGIRQKICNDACAVLVDESEADGKKMVNILRMFRSASSGATVLKGTSDQSGVDYTLRFCGMLTGIVPIELNQADNSRFLKLELLPMTADIKANISDEIKQFFIDHKKIGVYGKKMQMFMISNYKKLLEIISIVRSNLLLSASERYADTYGVLIACSYLAIHNNTDKENIDTFIKGFNFDSEIQRNSNKDHDELFETMMIKEISDEEGKSKKSFIKYIYEAYYNYKNEKLNDFKHLNSIIGKYGFRVLDDENNLSVLIDPSRGNIRNLIKGSRFENGDIKQVLQRLDNCEEVKSAKSIDGIQKRGYLKIVLNADKYNYSKYIQLKNSKGDNNSVNPFE